VKTKKQNMRKFLISCVITVVVVIVAAGSAFLVLRNVIQPPNTPDYVYVRLPVEPSNPNPGQNTSNTNNSENNENTNDNPEPEYTEVRMYRRPDFFTFLIYGLDEGFRADTIMVAAFDAVNQSAYLISIPRDTRIDVNRPVGQRKILGSYAWGRMHGRGHAGGVEYLKNEVQNLVGFRPDFYVSVDYNAFIRLVDAIGGVQINVPFHMRNTDIYQDLFIDIPAGLQTLDGYQTLNFVRFRESDEGFQSITDFQRMRNQQLVIDTIVRDLLSPRSIFRIPELVRIYRQHVQTNLSDGEIAWLVAQTTNLSNDLLSTYTLPIDRVERNGWYEMPDQEAILELINRTVNPFTTDITADFLHIVQ